MKETKKKTSKQKKTSAVQKLKETESYVKSAFLAAFLLVLFIGGTGISQMIGKSYAAVVPIDQLPDKLTSHVEGNQGLERVNYINPGEDKGDLSLPKRFYGTDVAGKVYELYCLERWLSMDDSVSYTKTESASQLSQINIDDKKMAYLLSQIYPNNDDFLSKIAADSIEKKYISQLAIWYFQDLNAGYTDDQEDQCSRADFAASGCEDPDNEGEFYWKSSLLKKEKEAIRASKYWKEISKVVTDALNYSEDTNYGITISKEGINYSLVEDNKYIESTLIDVIPTGSNFRGYSFTSDQKDIEFYNEQGAKIGQGTTLQPGQKFRFRIPTSTVRESKVLNMSIHVNGTFESKEAFMYLPEGSGHQRALIGTMQLKPINAGVELQINDPMGSVRISKVDATNGKEVPGATLVLTDSNGKEIARWVSTNEPYYIDPIKEGTYTLTETIAPEGYVMSTSSVTFTVVAGETTEVEMKNVPEISVPDTFSSIPMYVYIVGAIAFLIGAGLIYISLKPRHEQ